MVADATTNSNTKPNHHGHGHGHSGEHKQLDREVRDMVSAITSRVSHLHKVDGPSHGHHHDDHDDDDGHGVRIITLAGTNTGATLKSELDDEKSKSHHQNHHQNPHHDHDALRTYVNSNFQAINNSIMMGGSYTTNDPGVHMDIADVADHDRDRDHDHHHGHGHDHGHDKLHKDNKDDKDKKKKKKKDKEGDHHSGGSD